MRDSSNLSKGASAAVDAPASNAYLAVRIGAAFVCYLVLLGICFTLNPNNDNFPLMVICACATLAFTISFCVICFSVFAKAGKTLRADAEDASGDSADAAQTSSEPLGASERKGAAGSGAADNDAASANTGTAGSAGAAIAANKERYLALGKKCGLTKREMEVLGLLLEGKNARDIETLLCISRYTAKTHIGSVYRKADVHSQQELIEMFSQESSHAE